MSDFVIKNTILTQYNGSGGDVVIPDGVTRISDLVFCASPVTHVTIPASVTEICDNAFVASTTLKTVTIGGSVTIGRGAFDGCRNLTRVTIVGDAEGILECAFQGCKKLEEFSVAGKIGTVAGNAFHKCEKLSDSKGFLIFADILVSYDGEETHVVIPDNVTHLVSCSGKTIASLFVPDSVTQAEEFSMSGSKGMKLLSIPKALFDQWNTNRQNVYRLLGENCFTLAVRDGGNTTYYAYAGVRPTDYRTYNSKDSITQFIQREMWTVYDNDLQFNNVEFKYKPIPRLMGMLGRLLNPEQLSDECRTFFTAELIKGAKKLVAFAEEVCSPEIITRLLNLNLLDEKKKKPVMALIAESPVPEIAAIAGVAPAEKKSGTESAAEEAPTVQSSTTSEEIAKIYAQKWNDIKGPSILKSMKLVGVSMPETKRTDGTPAPADLFRFILASYGKMFGKTVAGFQREADEAAALLSYDSLCDAMDAISGNLNGPAYPAILPMLCRYGSPKQILQLTTAYKDWGEWGKFGAKGRTAQKTLMQFLVLSETKAAAVFLEKQGHLEDYAKIRGLTIDEVYERYLFDFGFDENGQRVLDLGSTQIEITLTSALGLELLNRTTGKPVKLIPKKGIDPAVQKKAANELDDMRQTLKKAVVIKQNQLWNAYLEKTDFPAANWKQSYLSNPFLNRIARILVWEQEGNTFLITDSGTSDSAGKPVTLSDAPIHIAHPMEMTREDVSAWQQYFTRKGLRQPFPQIWEPVLEQTEFRTDRYKGCYVRNVFFRKQEKRGVSIMWSYADYYENFDLDIQGFRLNFSPFAEDPERLEIPYLEPDSWNRRTNMILAWLDRLTVYDRIKKDDPTVMDQMDRFTFAQITDFIALAQENGAVNVTALLLEFKNSNFSNYDPMDEFTLDF